MYHYFPESYMWSHAMLLTLGATPWGEGEIDEIDTVGQRLKNRVGDNTAWKEGTMQPSTAICWSNPPTGLHNTPISLDR